MSETTKLIISVPNSIFIGHFFYAFFGRERQHPDHSASWSYKTLSQFLGKNQLVVDTFLFTFLPEQATNWKSKTYFYVCRLIARIFPMFSSTLLVVCSKPNK